MNLARKCKLIGLVLGLILSGCTSAQDLPTPDKIGEKERMRVITGKQAAGVVNRMHGQSVAADLSVLWGYPAATAFGALSAMKYFIHFSVVFNHGPAILMKFSPELGDLGILGVRRNFD